MATPVGSFAHGCWMAALVSLAAAAPACGNSGGGASTGGAPNNAAGTSTAPMNGGAGGTSSGGSTSGGAGTTGGSTAGSGGSVANAGKAGAGTSGSGAGSGASGGASAQGGASGATSGGAGTSAGMGTAGSAGGSSTLCTMGTWPAADPAMRGSFETVTENDVGPAAGEGADGGAPVAFTMFRPKDLSVGGLCHPVVTWGNGTGSNPSLYKVVLDHLASHGFVVIASNSPNVAQGDPPPMVAGVTWVLEQNDDPSSVLYGRIDTAHIGATGHSQGGFATTTAGGDEHITTIAPFCGASNQRNLHGPAWLFCGGMDTTVPCDTIQRAYDSISNQPVMLAQYVTADHANWITFRGTTPGPVEVAMTAWMRAHLMGDTALRSWFYGSDCKLCTDDAWQVQQKVMDQ